MKHNFWTTLLLVANLCVICGAFLGFLYVKYPLVGSDYGLALPSMLDSALHFRINGLSIQWYSPTFGGGQPAYPDPLNSQFSLPVLLTIFFDPMLSIVFSIILFVGVGLFASYYFFSHILELDRTSAILGAVFFSANGFMMQRVAIGHVAYTAFPVLAVILILLVDARIPKYIAGLLLALVVAVLLHMAGYFIIILFGFSVLIILPLIHIVKPEVFSWRRLLVVVTVGGCIAIFMTASKLSAVYSFMRFFPRLISEEYATSPLLGLLGIMLQLMGTMSLFPLFGISGLDTVLLAEKMTGFVGMCCYRYWEFDMALSPVVFGIVIIGIDNLLHRPAKWSGIFVKNRRGIAWLILITSIWLVTETILAKGILYPYIHELPIFNSLHVNYRLTAAFLFPLALVAAVLYNRGTVNWGKSKAMMILIVVNLLALLPLATYFTPGGDLIDRSYDLRDSQRIHQAMLEGNTFEITHIGDNEDNTLALLNHTSNLKLYNPIFGFDQEYFHPQVKPGSVWEISDGYFNMTNPTGFIFPEENHSCPFERIRVEEKNRMMDFVARRQPDWAIPVYQQVSNWISGVSTAMVLGTLVVYSATRRSKMGSTSESDA